MPECENPEGRGIEEWPCNAGGWSSSTCRTDFGQRIYLSVAVYGSEEAMAVPQEVHSRFTGMIFLLERVLGRARDGRLLPMAGPAMGYALRRPRRA